MTASRDRILHVVIVATLLLGGIVGAMAIGIRPSSATRLTDDRFSTANVGEEQAAEPAGDRGGSHRTVESVSEATFDEQVLQSPVPVIVDFYADWCGPCKTQGRILEEFAAELEGAKIVKVNVDDNEVLSQQFRIEAIPVLLIVKNGRVIGRHEGVTTKEQLKAALAD